MTEGKLIDIVSDGYGLPSFDGGFLLGLMRAGLKQSRVVALCKQQFAMRARVSVSGSTVRIMSGGDVWAELVFAVPPVKPGLSVAECLQVVKSIDLPDSPALPAVGGVQGVLGGVLN